MRYLSICSGIEAASCAWHSLGWTPLAFSEIEKFPRKVLAHHYPDVPLHGDFTALRDQPWIGAADLLVGGTPCQAFSVAGLRGSLSDERGNLTLEFVRLANAVDDLRSPDDPAWILWENVPGVLSTADNAFGAFLGGLAGCDAAVVNSGPWPSAGVVAGPRRVVVWRILDAQYYGVAQRRRRVFVLARGRAAPCGGWSASDALLPISQGGGGDFAPRRKTREGVAGTLASRTSGGGAIGALTASGRGVARVGESRGQDPVVPWEIAPAVTAKWAKGSAGPAGDECQNLVFDTTQITSKTNRSNPKPGDPCHSLAAGAHPPMIAFHPTQDPISSTDGTTHALGCGSSGGQASVAVAVALRGRDGGATAEVGDDVAFALRASSGGGDKPHVLTSFAVRRLTPTECERLQGFPDGWTDIGPATPDGPRYKALGNSMAVPVMAWIGRRITEVCK